MKTQKLILFTLYIFFCLNIQAQNYIDFSITKLSPNDGLSQGSNYFRYEDSLGYMWITANDAVNRYNGSEVKVYNLNKYFDKCPNLAQAYGIVEDNQHNIYFGSTNGLYHYNRNSDTFQLINIYADNKLTMPFGFWQNKIWCFNNLYEIVSYDVTTKKIAFLTKLSLPEIPSVHAYNQNLSQYFYQSFPIIVNDKQAWFCTKKQVVSIDLKNGKTRFPLQKFSKNLGLVFNSIYKNKTKNEIFFTTNKGIVNFSLSTKKAELITSIDQHSLKNSFSAIANNEVLVVSQFNYLTIIDIKTKKINYTNNNNTTYTNFEFDKNNRLWFCDDGKGQIIFDFNPSPIQKVTKENYFKNTDFNGVASINPINSDEFLINSKYIYHKNQKTITKTTGFLNSLSSYRTSYDKVNKGIWLYNDGAIGNDLLSFMDKNKKITHYANKETIQQYGLIQDVKPITENLILMACEKGLFLLNKSLKKINPIANQTQNNAFYISSLSNNRLAISYINHDMLLANIDKAGNLIFEKHILPSKQSFYIQEDLNKQQYWAATNSGLFLLDKNFKIISIFDANSGFSGTYIYGILMDDFGNIWLSHQRGLSTINTKTHQIINYDLNDGVQDWDFNNRAFCKVDDGTLYFGGTKGFNYFKPPIVFQSNYIPKIYFDDIKANGESLIYNRNTNQPIEFQLDNKKNNILINAQIVDLQNGNKQRLMYRIKNIDNHWKPIIHKSPLVLSSLTPREYDIEFGIYNKINQTTKSEKLIKIFIRKAFYQTYWFYVLLGGLCFGGIVFAISRWQLVKNKNHFKQQLALETQLNKITADLHDDIGASLSSLQINSAVAMAYLAKNNTTQTLFILNKIQQQSKKLSDNIGEFVWSLKSGNDQLMSLSTRIKNFVNEILGSTNIYYAIKIDKEIDEEIKDITARKNIMLITKEALNNIAKYSKADKVFVIFKKTELEYVLEIKDNGTGFNVQKVNGNGLQNMKKRTEELGGIFDISTTNGTFIKICIPKFRDLPVN